MDIRLLKQIRRQYLMCWYCGFLIVLDRYSDGITHHSNIQEFIKSHLKNENKHCAYDAYMNKIERRNTLRAL